MVTVNAFPIAISQSSHLESAQAQGNGQANAWLEAHPGASALLSIGMFILLILCCIKHPILTTCFVCCCCDVDDVVKQGRLNYINNFLSFSKVYSIKI
jgi:hypothetical protein